MQDDLTAAIALQQAGQLTEAAELFESVIAREPSSALALHMLGVIRLQQGDPARAVDLIGRAAALRPSVAAFHANLGEAYRSLGQFQRAVGCCRTALVLAPDMPEGACTLGLALQNLGRSEEAAEAFRRALELRPDMVAAHHNLGLILQAQGQTEQAIAHFRRAVELAPALNGARTNLALLLIDAGRAEEALEHCREAIRQNPDMAELHHNLGHALWTLDRLVEARACYLEAIRLDPGLALSHLQLGITLFREGQLHDALPWYKQAVALDPDDPLYWENLAELHREREEHAEAVAGWERVLALAPEPQVGPHLGLGWALQEAGCLDEAAQHYRAALRIEPDSAPAWFRVGGLHEERGELPEAEAALRAALRSQPDYAHAHARLATLLRGNLPGPDLAALEGLLTGPPLAPDARLRLLFAIAHVFDGRGEFARAADALRAANALDLQLAPAHQKYVPAEHRMHVDGMMRTFDAEFFERHAGAGLETRRPVFVVGLPRSGTTLIEQVLASHPQVHGAGELRLAPQTFNRTATLLGRRDRPIDCMPLLVSDDVRRLAQQHLDALEALGGRQAVRIVDKMPDNYLYLGLLAVLFPNATFIHCRRDLRDIAVSCWMTDFRNVRWASDPAHIGTRFQEYLRLMSHWNEILPAPIHDVHYEDTVDDLESVARRLLEASGLDWDPACLAFHQTNRAVRTASITQVRQPIYSRSVARWKNYERELADLFQALPEAELSPLPPV